MLLRLTFSTPREDRYLVHPRLVSYVETVYDTLRVEYPNGERDEELAVRDCGGWLHDGEVYTDLNIHAVAVANDEDPWSDDLVQFARLLDEINGSQALNYAPLCESMDLTAEQINELFDRAMTVFEESKRRLCPPCPPAATGKLAMPSGGVYKVRLNYRTPESLLESLGETDPFEAGSQQEAINLAMDNDWEPRLDAAGCVPALTATRLPDSIAAIWKAYHSLDPAEVGELAAVKRAGSPHKEYPTFGSGWICHACGGKDPVWHPEEPLQRWLDEGGAD